MIQFSCFFFSGSESLLTGRTGATRLPPREWNRRNRESTCWYHFSEEVERAVGVTQRQDVELCNEDAWDIHEIVLVIYLPCWHKQRTKLCSCTVCKMFVHSNNSTVLGGRTAEP